METIDLSKDNQIEEKDKGVSFRVKVNPGSSENRFKGFQTGYLKVDLKEPAEEGKANKELLETLSNLLGVGEEDLKIIKGSKSSKKKVYVEGDPVELRERIEGI